MATATAAPEVAVVAAMITPALLILASASLLATVLARIGRIVDLVRKIGEAAKQHSCGASDAEQRLLKTLARRGKFAETALVSYYAAVVCFVLTCLLIGIDRFVHYALYIAPISSAMIGVLLVLTGSAFMVGECRMAMRQLAAEVEGILPPESPRKRLS